MSNSEKFRYSSAYQPDASVVSVVYGYDMPLLEVELNESQEIQNGLRKNIAQNIMPSGFTELVSKNFLAAPIIYNPVSAYRNILNSIAIAPCKAMVNGYIINLSGNFVTEEANNYILLDLGEAPHTGTREDLVYLEVWFERISYKDDIFKNGYIQGNTLKYNIRDTRVNEETTQRTVLKYNIKVVQNVDFENFPDGLGYSDINHYSNIQATIDGKLGYARNANLIYRSANDIIFKDCEFYKDYNLYIAGRPDYTLTNERVIGKYIYALPMFRIRRHNREMYSITNFNGSRTSIYTYKESNSSANGDLLGGIRPDKLCYDVLDKSDILDLRRSVSTDILNEYYLNKGLKDLFTGKLQTKHKQTMRRIQFGREDLKYTSADSVIMHTSYNDKTVKPDENTLYPSKVQTFGEPPKFRDSVSKYGLYVDGRSEYLYSLQGLNSHMGTVDFYIQFYYDGFTDYDQHILSILNANDSPVYRLRKVGTQLVGDIYTMATDALSGYQQIIVDLSNILIFSKRIYHIRFSWSDNAQINKALIYINGVIVGETQYMGSTLSPTKILIGNKDDFEANRVEIDTNLRQSQYIAKGDTELVKDEVFLNNGKLSFSKIRINTDKKNIRPLEYVTVDGVNYQKVRINTNITPTKNELKKIKQQEPIAVETENINYGFILEELAIYNVAFEQNINNGIYTYISNNYWPNIPQDFIANQALIYPSFNSTYMNYSDNDIRQENTLKRLTCTDGRFILDPPYIGTIHNTPKIYKIAGEANRYGQLIEITGTWSRENNKYVFTPERPYTDDAIVQFTLDIPNGNGGEDLPNEILAAGLVSSNSILAECSFARLNTIEPRKVSYLNPARVSAAIDTAYDLSTNRDTYQYYARVLYYHLSGNGTNYYELPSTLYGYPIIGVMNVTNRVVTEIKKDTTDISRFAITLNENVAYGDVVEFKVALGGWTFDYETQTKTLVANLHKTKILRVVADGNRHTFIIPCFDENGNGGVLKSVCSVTTNIANDLGTIISQEEHYACYVDGEMYPLQPDRDEFGDILDTWSHQLCTLDVEQSSFGSPFLKVTLNFTPADGQILEIPVLVSHQPDASEILSIWYNYVPYQGILNKTHKKLKRLTDWKYFITTLGAGNNTLKTDEENINSLNNVVDRLPGGNAFSSLLTGEKINFTNTKKIDGSYELRFVQDVLYAATDNALDNYFFELDADMEIYRLTSGFQDERLNYTFNSFKAYLPDNMTIINKYTGMASLVMDERGQILLFVIGCLNNGNISFDKSSENILMPIYGDLFKLEGLPTTLIRN